jgi:transposase
VDEILDKLTGQGTIFACNEAGPCGYGLAHYIENNRIQYQVFAPSKIPRKPGERRKTDHRDSLKLSQLPKYGAGTPVHILLEQDEAARELLRYRNQVRRKAGKEKQKSRMFLLQYDRASYEHKPWTLPYMKWLYSLDMGQLLLTDVLRRRLDCLEYLQVELKELDKQITEIAAQERYKDEISSLRCLNGVGTLTALALRCDVGYFRRFSTARSFMAFLVLVPDEHSSGNTIRCGSTTKTGNSYFRRLLVESSWMFVSREKNSGALRKKREGLDHQFVQCVKKASRRLHNRYHQLFFSRGNRRIAVTAVARELSGFVWGIMTGHVVI